MTVATYIAGLALVLSVVWLAAISIGTLRRSDGLPPSWRTVWPAILAVASTAASFLMLRFVAAESPVAAAVVVRGWLGLFAVLAVVSALCAGVLMMVARRRAPAPCD